MTRKKLLIFTLAFGTFSILNTEVGILGILPNIANQFNVSVSTAGLLVSLFAIIVAVSGPITPTLATRLKTKPVLLSVLAVFFVANIVSALAPNFTVALVGRLVPAFFHPVYCSLALTLAANAVEPKESAKAVSRVMMGVSSGMVLGTPIATIIASHISYQAAMIFFALVNALAFILNLFFLPNHEPQQRQSQSTHNEPAMRQVLTKRALWISGLGTIAIGIAMFSVYGYVSDYLTNISHFNANQLSLVLFLFGLLSLGGNLIAGSALSSNARRLIRTYPFALIAIYALMFIFSHSVAFMFIIVSVWGILYGIGNNLQQYLISSSIPEAANFANGLFIALGNLGTTLGTSLGGIVLGAVSGFWLPLLGILTLVVTFVVLTLRNRAVSTELSDLAEEV